MLDTVVLTLPEHTFGIKYPDRFTPYAEDLLRMSSPNYNTSDSYWEGVYLLKIFHNLSRYTPDLDSLIGGGSVIGFYTYLCCDVEICKNFFFMVKFAA